MRIRNIRLFPRWTHNKGEDFKAEIVLFGSEAELQELIKTIEATAGGQA
jgi:hypothetical protein